MIKILCRLIKLIVSNNVSEHQEHYFVNILGMKGGDKYEYERMEKS